MRFFQRLIEAAERLLFGVTPKERVDLITKRIDQRVARALYEDANAHEHYGVQAAEQLSPSEMAATIEEIRKNVQSIRAVPFDILPKGGPRQRLALQAALGEDVYCYQSGGPSGTWCVWLATRRVTVEEYIAEYQATYEAAHVQESATAEETAEETAEKGAH